MRWNINNFNLYSIVEFKFREGVIAPQFGIITHKHGTIYPLEYDIKRDSEIG